MNNKLKNLMREFNGEKDNIIPLIKEVIIEFKKVVAGKVIYEGYPVIVDFDYWGQLNDEGDAVVVCLGGAALLTATGKIANDQKREDIILYDRALTFLDCLRFKDHSSGWGLLKEQGLKIPEGHKSVHFWTEDPQQLIQLLEEFVNENSY